MNASQVMTEQASTTEASTTPGSADTSGAAKSPGFWTLRYDFDSLRYDGRRPIVSPLIQMMFFVIMMFLWAWLRNDVFAAVGIGSLWISYHMMSIEQFMRRQSGNK